MQRSFSPMTMGYSILVGPILWFAHFIFVYALTEFGCRANFTNWWYFPPETIRIWIILVTVPVLLLVAIGIFLGYGGLRGRSSEDNEGYFLASSGILLSALFLFIIIMTTTPSFVLAVCDKAS
jgi:hypothetical protein